MKTLSLLLPYLLLGIAMGLMALVLAILLVAATVAIIGRLVMLIAGLRPSQRSPAHADHPTARQIPLRSDGEYNLNTAPRVGG
jgi:hypothetical protein